MTVYKSRSPSKYKSQKYIKSKKIVMIAVARQVRRQVTCLGHFILYDDETTTAGEVDCTGRRYATNST